ncbi:MAG: hypothetical protein EHM21_11725 [Chloroflexi bacterium]|nr:MAG: hypothetical protein EHM21_11725 [Chloroflexota bacterium]
MKLVDPRTYRATTEAWLGQLLLPVCFFIMLTITAINTAGLSPVYASVGLALLVVIVTLNYLVPMTRNWLSLDGISIEGSLDGRYFQVYWNEILAAWLYDANHKRFLCLGTREGTLIISLRFFDHASVWNQVRGSVSPAALEENAIERLPDFRGWEKARGKALEDPKPRQVTDHWVLQVIGWSGVTFFAYGAIDAWQAGSLLLAVVYICILMAFGVMLLSWGVTEIGPEQISRLSVFGRWVMAWDEVRWIEIDLLDTVIVLVGDKRRLVIPGPGIWNVSGKRELMRVLLAQVEQRCLPLRRTPMAMFRISRNTRAKKQREDQS